MPTESDKKIDQNKIKTFRWLFYICVIQLLICFLLPVFMFPFQVLFNIEILIALTVGLLFGLYFLGVNIYGIFIDKSRHPIYITLIILICGWTIWAIITWRYIEHMRYLT